MCHYIFVCINNMISRMITFNCDLSALAAVIDKFKSYDTFEEVSDDEYFVILDIYYAIRRLYSRHFYDSEEELC